MDVGTRIRRFRLTQKRTLQEIADECGFTKSLLSKIENGKTIPPVSTLVKIARRLGVKVSTLLGEDDFNNIAYVKSDSITPDKMIKTNKGYAFYTIASDYKNKLIQPFVFTAKKNEIKKQSLSHSGQEFMYMLEGTMKYRIGNTEYLLNPGDCLYFDSLNEHELRLVTDEVKYLAVFSEAETDKS